MIPDIANIDTTNISSTFMGMNLDPTHLLWSTILVLVLSHIGANYLKNNTPRGYMFWFTILNLLIGFLFI